MNDAITHFTLAVPQADLEELNRIEFNKKENSIASGQH